MMLPLISWTYEKFVEGGIFKQLPWLSNENLMLLDENCDAASRELHGEKAVETIEVISARHSGSTWMRLLLQTRLCATIRDPAYFWKHDTVLDPRYFLPPLATYKTGVLLITREPYAWLQSMHRQPFANDGSIFRGGLPMGDFLRTAWNTTITDPSHGPPGAPNPVFENVVEMRRTRLMRSLKLRDSLPVGRFLHVRYEDLRDHREDTLRRIAVHFNYPLTPDVIALRLPRLRGSQVVRQYNPWRNFFGWTPVQFEAPSDTGQGFLSFTPKDRKFIRTFLNSSMEEALGYAEKTTARTMYFD